MTVVKIQDFKNMKQADINALTQCVASWYVRKDNKYFPTNRLTTKLSKEDVERACIIRFRTEFPELNLTSDGVKEIFRRAIEQRHDATEETIPVWNGSSFCKGGSTDRYIWQDGVVSINTWCLPPYRAFWETTPDLGLFGNLVDTMLVRKDEREMFLNWLTWCLRNEHAKPKWAPFFYSKTKGSGKSTLCELVARLFGTKNSVTQNNIDKLVARFNMTVLQSKLVICEELNLRPGSSQGNALKTFLTEETALAERKGQEAETISQSCCFLFTTNHLPLWMEANDRRYYLIDVDHEGHASGSKAREFSELVGSCKDAYRDPETLAQLWLALISRELPEEFSAETLDVAKHATPLMTRVHGASTQTIVDQLNEALQEQKKHAVSEKQLTGLIRETLGANINTTKHMMTELGWTKSQVKWGGKDYRRSVWVQDEFWAEQGFLRGPNGFEEPLDRHLQSFYDDELVVEETIVIHKPLPRDTARDLC